MSYFAENKQNSTSLAMFASVGLHAVLFVSMAFFPATSETIKKPLRVVNLLPPGQVPPGTPSSQAKTQTLQDILNNPLPDLSAGLPPLGNTDQPPPNLADDSASSYLSDGPGRVNTDLDWTNPPNQSFAANPNESAVPAPNPSSKPPTPPPSSITPAPSNTTPPATTPNSSDILPPVDSAFPSPFPGGVTPSAPQPGSGGVIVGALTPEPGEQIPASRQRVIPIISETVAYNYPKAACRDRLQGTATLSYYRQPDGSYVPGTGDFENETGHSVLDDTALDAVINAPATGTGSYQRYSSRFDFVYSDVACSGADGSQQTTVDDPSDNKTSETPSKTSVDVESKSEGEDSKSDAPESKDTESKSNTPDSSSGESPKPEKNTPKSGQDSSNPSGDASSSPGPSAPTPPAPAVPVEPAPLPQPAVPENNGTASDLIPIEPVEPEPIAPAAPAEPPPILPQPPVEPPAVEAPAPAPPAAPEPASSESLAEPPDSE